MLEQLIIDYINDTENPEKNWLLAQQYYSIGQTASAITYYLRTAERTTDKNLVYDCLVLMSQCFDQQGNRNYTVKNMLYSAIAVDTHRPEAYYFLSRKLEQEREFFQAYATVEIALNTTSDTYKNPSIGYPGKWSLIFQKAVAAWWRGRDTESKQLFQYLLDNHWDEMDEIHKNSVNNNICNLAVGSDSFKMYRSDLHTQLRYKFAGSEQIKTNYSQVFQDMFVLSMLDGKPNGKFLEIGSADPARGNNTFLLEKYYGWQGVAIEYNSHLADKYASERSSIVYRNNALDIDYSQLLSTHFTTTDIDYLQLDIDPAKFTYGCLLKIPFDQYRFSVITYEHDYYADLSRSYREKSRKFLESKGYVLVVNDVSADGICSFEDWWVHPELVSADIINKMRSQLGKTTDIADHMLNSARN